MGDAVDLLESVSLGGEVHEHLKKECPWYRNVSEEKNCTTPEDHCQPATGKHGAPAVVVKFTADGCEWVALTPRTPEASTVPKPTVPPGGPGLFHIKGRELPPYVQHLWAHLAPKYGKHKAYGMAIGIVKRWAAGVNPGGWKTKSGKGKRTHADVRAAAAKNVAEWEKDKADAHKQSSSHKHVKASATLALAQPGPMQPATGGSTAQYGLNQRPAQSVSPSPPLPPKVQLPTASEVMSLAGQVPDSADVTLSNTAKTFLRAASRKLELNDEQQALMALRGAQTALAAAHRADVAKLVPDRSAMPAVQSSERTGDRAKTDQWRKLEFQTATLIDRMRKRFFHGQLNSQVANARLTGENMSGLDKVLALAGQRVATGHDVSEPVTSDTSGETPLLQQPENLFNVTDADASRQLASLPALDKVRVDAYMAKARDMVNTNPAGAAQFAARAAVIAKESGAHDLARHIHKHIEALAAMGNRTAGKAQAELEPTGRRDSPESPHGANVTLSASLKLASAGSSAGHTAGSGALPSHSSMPGPGVRPAAAPQKPKLDAHQLHALHEKHLAHLHALHVAHLQHLQRMAGR